MMLLCRLYVYDVDERVSLIIEIGIFHFDDNGWTILDLNRNLVGLVFLLQVYFKTKIPGKWKIKSIDFTFFVILFSSVSLFSIVYFKNIKESIIIIFVVSIFPSFYLYLLNCFSLLLILYNESTPKGEGGDAVQKKTTTTMDEHEMRVFSGWNGWKEEGLKNYLR